MQRPFKVHVLDIVPRSVEHNNNGLGKVISYEAVNYYFKARDLWSTRRL